MVCLMNNWEMPVLKKKVAHFAKGYQCKICEKVSVGKRNLDTHMSTHETYIDNRNPDWSCSICGKIFSAKHLLQRHTSQIHKEVKIKCELCAGDYKKSEMKVHRKSHGPKCFKCKICNFKCSVNTQVKQHMKNHTQGNSRKCNNCPMVFRCSGNLKKHEERIHNKANVSKNAECLTCGYRFQFSTQLQKHIKEIHFNERPFPCQSCTKCFKRRSHLKDHLILHSGTKPFKCELCGDSFAGDTSLRLHKMIHTNVTSVRKVSDKSTIWKHIKWFTVATNSFHVASVENHFETRVTWKNTKLFTQKKSQFPATFVINCSAWVWDRVSAGMTLYQPLSVDSLSGWISENFFASKDTLGIFSKIQGVQDFSDSSSQCPNPG